jgi:hypothetical protein
MNEGGADLSGSRGEGKEMKAIRETNRPKRGKARTRLGWLRQLLDPLTLFSTGSELVGTSPAPGLTIGVGV